MDSIVMNYEQPEAYVPISPSAFSGLVEQAAKLPDTEKRQAFAQECFPYAPSEYVRFMQAVQGCVQVLQDTEQGTIDRYATHSYLKAKGTEIGLQRFADEKYANSGALAAVMQPGGDAVFEGADEVEVPVWGDGEDVLMADGEALMIAGGSGVGKTTIAVQFLRARLGLQTHVLGYRVQPTRSKVLYLACDRPKQAMKVIRRLFPKEEWATMNEKLVVRKGPPKDFAANPECMLELCLEAGADTVIVDSLKDVALGLAKDEVGAGYNSARQHCVSNGIQVLELHHNVKRIEGAPTINDVYGSTWLTTGAGSVIILDGKPGDPVVKFWHVKQPMREIGPVNLMHDHATGISAFADRVDLLGLCRNDAQTVTQVAKVLFDTEKPSPSEKEKARRKLNDLVERGVLKHVPAVTPGAPDLYAAATLLTDYEGAPEAAQAASQETLH